MNKVIKLRNFPYTFSDYSSLDAFIKAGLDQSKSHPENKGLHQRIQSGLRADPEWLGIEGGHEGWRRYVREGAQTEQKRIRELAAKFKFNTPKGIRTKRRSTRGPQGDELDIHSVRSGNLDRAWRRTTKIEKKGKAKRITILYNTPIYAKHKFEQAFYGPAAAAILCDKLSEAKVAIEIIAMDWTDGIWGANPHGIKKDLNVVRIKNTSAPLSMAALAATATAGYTRSALFNVQVASALRCNSGMGGRDRNYSEALVRETFQRPEGHAIIVPELFSEAEAIRFITKTLQGIEK